jgi:hypothetical protein
MMKIAGVRPGQTTRNYFPRRNYTAGGFSKPDQSRPGTLDVQFGVTPSDYEVQQNLMRLGMAGGSPSRRPAPQSPMTPVGAQTAPAAPAGPSLFEKLVADSQAKEDEANRQNQLRYDQVLTAQDTLADRVMGQVDNWGNVQGAINTEKAAEILSAIKADMAARGIANSNVTPAFQQRNARDLALTQQDLSERKSARRIGYDTALTQDQNAFIERRNDVGPDQNALLQLALEYGRSGNGTGSLPQAQQQAAAPKRRYKPINQVPQSGGVPAAYAPFLASMMQGNYLGGLNAAARFMRPMTGGPAYTSNRYPTKRTPEQYAAIKQQSSDGGGITSNSHPVGFAGNVAGLAYNAWPGIKGAASSAAGSVSDGLLGALTTLDRRAMELDPNASSKNAPGVKKVFDGIYSAGHAALNFRDWLNSR